MTSTVSTTSRRARIVELAISGYDGPSIATQVKLSLRQVRRYLADAGTRALIRELETERLREITRRAAAIGGGAVVVLGTIMNDRKEPSGARVAAAGRLLDAMIRLSEHNDLAERIASLEMQLGRLDDDRHEPNRTEPTWATRTAG